VSVKNDVIILPGVVSRKKQIIPNLVVWGINYRY
jgi:inorganic pyrophosphatase/exopolyphosphatase